MTSARLPRLPRRAAASWAVALTVCLGPVPAVAVADPAAGSVVTAQQARRDADRAQRRVQQLVTQLDEQLQQRADLMSELAGSVQRSVSRDVAAQEAADAAARERGRHARAVRALYRDGGAVALLSSVLESRSVEDALGRAGMARTVLDVAAGRADTAARSSVQARDAADVANQASLRDVATVSDVTDAGTRIEATLVAAELELATLTQRAAALESAEAARRSLEAARRRAAAASAALAPAAAPAVAGIPAQYGALYRQAASARCPGMRWTLLAAVGQVESGHGRNTGPSSAGAVGPMQFMPRTFDAYGVDGDEDGVADPWNPADAVHSAAVYLCVNGGGGDAGDVQRALLRYNNAQWYVDLVLSVEAQLVASGASADA